LPERKKILVAALDWGMGHATRLVPLIRSFQKNGDEVILASAGKSYAFFKSYFPELLILQKPAYNIRYSERYSLSFAIILQIPKIILAIFREHFWLKKIIQQHNFTEVVSDNCYGLWNKKIRSVFITHQLNIILNQGLKFMEFLVNKIILWFISKYDECLVPDLEGEINYAGKLSHIKRKPENVKYIGVLSRFDNTSTNILSKTYDLVVLLSGPEPQRTILEEKISLLLQGQSIACCIIRGLPGNTFQKENSSSITWLNHAGDEVLKSLLINAKKIVCRSGYSTIMDCIALEVNALLIPTPGQTEQEYLAEYNKDKGMFQMISQDSLSINELLDFNTENKSKKVSTVSLV
jgi:uncharacterized protein (TIGR00661 family)